MPELMDLRILLLQARNEEDLLEKERDCFREHCRVRSEQIRGLNVLEEPLTDRTLLGADVLMIGGSGIYSAVNDYGWMPALLDLIRQACNQRLPTFGSCWGHQVIARALGGTVIHDSDRAEIGCLPVMLTEAGRNDVLFGELPAQFPANMGHHDRVSVLPETAVELAYSETQRNQAFRVAGLPVYTTQFHSELDFEHERERLFRYRAHYPELDDEATFNAVMESLAETTDVDHLLHDFLVRIVLGHDLETPTPPRVNTPKSSTAR